jgi:parallel beta-helix repeat protein
MYKPAYAQGILISLICAVLVLGLGCGGEKQTEPETTPKRRAERAQSVSSRPKVKGTEIGGQIKEDTTLSLGNSPYILNRNLEILPDVKLTIEPGVVIKAATYTAIVVRGNFHAIGKPDKHIKFTSLRENDKWDGIQIKDESFDYESDELIEGYGCTIQYCEIKNASTGISCENAAPLISNNIIQNGGEGIKCRDSANPVITKNLIKDNIDGIVCADYSSPEIKYNTIIGDEGKGISCVNHSSPLIVYNTIFGGGETWWTGILCQNGSAPRINHNNIYSNGGHNLKQVQIKPGEESLTLDAKNNWWGAGDKDTIATTIFDKSDKSSLGEVNFIPFAKTKIKNANHLGEG